MARAPIVSEEQIRTACRHSGLGASSRCVAVPVVSSAASTRCGPVSGRLDRQTPRRIYHTLELWDWFHQIERADALPGLTHQLALLLERRPDRDLYPDARPIAYGIALITGLRVLTSLRSVPWSFGSRAVGPHEASRCRCPTG